MKSIVSRFAALTLTTTSVLDAGLVGDEVHGILEIKGLPGSGNWFELTPRDSPTGLLPIAAVVGSGVEFAFLPAFRDYPDSTYRLRVTADVGENTVTIRESYSGLFNASGGGVAAWELVLSDLSLTITQPTVVVSDPSITLTGFDAHSLRFSIAGIDYNVFSPSSMARTTVVQLQPVPKPSMTALAVFAMAAAGFWSRNGVRSRNQ